MNNIDALRKYGLSGLSFPGNLSVIMKAIINIDPRSMLDIGCGYGKYGFLTRECCPHISKIDGIEGDGDFIGDIQRLIYDNIYIGDLREILPKLDGYDLIIAIDVLEHMPEKDAKEMLEMCRMKGKNVIVSVPRYKTIRRPHEQFGDTLMDHHYDFKRSDFRHIKGKSRLPSDTSLIYHMGTKWYLNHWVMRFLGRVMEVLDRTLN